MLPIVIDGDIIKYSVGFACQKTVLRGEDGRPFILKRVKDGMQLQMCDTGEQGMFLGVYTKKAVLDQLEGAEAYQENIIQEPDRNCMFTVKRLISSILKATGASAYQVHLSKGDCFRAGVYDQYKANRLNSPKPLHLPTIENYLIQHHGAIVNTEIEADDAMATFQYQNYIRGVGTVICSLDKDLDMIPGYHYNWEKKSIYEISEEEGMFNFWCQMLTGDTVDNIPGIPGIGKKTAIDMLHGYKISALRDIVAKAYKEHGWGPDEFKRNSMLLWMLRDSLENTYGKSYQEFFV